MRTVQEVPPYQNGLGRDALPRVDFADAFAVELPAGSDLRLASLAKVGYEACPAWVKAAMAVRGVLAGAVGLKTGREFLPKDEADWQRAVEALSPQFSADGREVLIGLDDWHLDFRASLLVQPGEASTRLVVTTLVYFKHWVGRAYFVPVRIGHRWVVPAMLEALRRRFMQIDSGGCS